MKIEMLELAFQNAKNALLAEQNEAGYWKGELASSALSTATAIAALYYVERLRNDFPAILTPERTEGQQHNNFSNFPSDRLANSTNPHDHSSANYHEMIRKGFQWLIDQQNKDGGWGDTVKSNSNISTTMLCRAAIALGTLIESRSPPASGFKEEINLPDLAAAESACEMWLDEHGGKTMPARAEKIRQRYGKDRTFAVPILTVSALTGLVDWSEVPRLPFELAVLPQSWYRFVRLPVVSYALPALIAIGHIIHQNRLSLNPFIRVSRWVCSKTALKLLRTIQPSSGGYLEATPLTSFVVMSLANLSPRTLKNKNVQTVIRKGIEFIIQSQRPDGSWPIDTDLSIWVTTLSVNSLVQPDGQEQTPTIPHQEKLSAWIIDQQEKSRHPYTGASPGGWGWSNHPGRVPDGDDTPGALLALLKLSRTQIPIQPALKTGLQWLLDLQNGDGGWPTFCRGWGYLPFDRSGTDLTAHVIRAFQTYLSRHPEADPLNERLQSAMEKGFQYLAKMQQANGSWIPLWFGNQHNPNEENPIYGTAKVLAAYSDCQRQSSEECQRGIAYLLSCQHPTGGWGDCHDKRYTSIEETALATDILLDLLPEAKRNLLAPALTYLTEMVNNGEFRTPSPIGFYFAKLWYFEKMYPLIFTCSALTKARRIYLNEKAK